MKAQPQSAKILLMKRKYRCIYCNSVATTRDHVPPKIFLDPPLNNCKTVPSCLKCNQLYGKDDEFFAYFIEFMRSVELGNGILERNKIQKIFNHSSSIEDRLFASIGTTDGSPELAYISFERTRIDAFLRRLAVAHVFITNNQRLPLNIGWSTTCFFARPLFNGFYKILGAATGEERIFHDDISWIADSHKNYCYCVNFVGPKVYFKIRDVFFALASWVAPAKTKTDF